MPDNQEMFLGEESVADAVLFELLEITEPLPATLPGESTPIQCCLDMGVLQYVVDQARGNQTICDEERPDGHPASSAFGKGFRLIKGVAVSSTISRASDAADGGSATLTTEEGAETETSRVASRVVIMSAELLPESDISAAGFPADPPITRAVACGFQQIATGDAEDSPTMDVALCVAALRVPAIATDLVVCVNCPTEQARKAAAQASGDSAEEPAKEPADEAATERMIADTERQAGLTAAMARAKDLAVRVLASLTLHDSGLFG
jgi:hypothetical protein